MLALCHSSTPYRPHLQLFELPEVSFLVIPNAARWVLHSIIPPPLRLVHPASHPDLSRGRPRASQDLAKTLQAKAGTQGAFMLRCCGIVAAASRILNSDIGNEVVAILSAISRVPPEDIATYAGEITAHVGPEF